MKQKKLKFVFIGLLINILVCLGFWLKDWNNPILWGMPLGSIDLLIGVFAHYNSKDKKILVENNKLKEAQVNGKC